MKIPESAADEINFDDSEAYIANPIDGKTMLTRREAVDAINQLSGMLLIDGDIRRHKKSEPEYSEDKPKA